MVYRHRRRNTLALLGLQRFCMSSFMVHHLAPLSIKQRMLHGELLRLHRAVRHLRLHMQQGLLVRRLHVGPDKGSKRGHADCCRLQEPCVAIDASPFVEPPLLQRSISPDAQQVVTTIVHILRHVVNLCGIATGLCAHIEAIEPHTGIAKYAVQLYTDVLAQILSRNLYHLAIPAHAAVRILPTYRLVSVRVAGLTSIRQRRSPVVGHTDCLPRRVVELLGIGAFVMDAVGLGQVVEVLSATAKVLLRVGSMPHSKLPALTESDFLSHTLGCHTNTRQP